MFWFHRDVSGWGGAFPPANEVESNTEHSDWTPSRPENVMNAYIALREGNIAL